MTQSISRANKWHKGDLNNWSPLEWAACMAGEAGEACNAAKKLKRITDNIQNIANVTSIEVPDIATAHDKIGQEIADTILYATCLAASINIDLEEYIIKVFNLKSLEYGFPERL